MILKVLFFFLSASLAGAFIIDDECLTYPVYPVMYDLTIIPHSSRGDCFYNGYINITVIVNAPNIQYIELDAVDLHIKKLETSRVLPYDGRQILASSYYYNTTAGKIRINYREPLLRFRESNTYYTISIAFDKRVNKASSGIFIVPYNEDGPQNMWASRLSPRAAPAMFPCFSNPRFETVFRIHVYKYTKEQQLRNTLVIAQPENEPRTQGDYITINYETSPRIAVRQVGFSYSDLSSRFVTHQQTLDSIHIWTRPSQENHYIFMLQFSEAMLNLIHRYSRLHKLRPITTGPIHIVSIPSGGIDGYEIDSWNLLTNSEIQLAHRPHATSVRQEQRMTLALALQLARAWLCNPGEPAPGRTRWKEEWFKEGVATYLAYYFLAQYHHPVGPSWPKTDGWPLDFYGLQMKHDAMAEDSFHSTPFLAAFNQSLAIEIPDRYQHLVMYKTASILWMVENWIGSQLFHDSLVKYINSRRGKNIYLKEFMSVLDEETIRCEFFNGTKVSEILQSWFYQPGYPVINVQVFRDRVPNIIQLKQHRFSFREDHRAESSYIIPVSYVAQHRQHCYNCNKPRFTIQRAPYAFAENLDDGWIILNNNASGYYRVNYDTYTWELIAGALRNYLSVPEQNRAQIVNDVFALYAAGLMDWQLATKILGYLHQETSAAVWDAAANGFQLLKTPGAACDMTRYQYDAWKEFMRGEVGAVYSRVSSALEQQHFERLLRSHIVQLACSVGLPECLKDMQRMSLDRVDPDVRCTLYQIREGGEERFHADYNDAEEAHIARARWAEEKKFLVKLPQGQPWVMKDHENLELSTERPTPQAADQKDGSETLAISTLLLAISSILAIVIR